MPTNNLVSITNRRSEPEQQRAEDPARAKEDAIDTGNVHQHGTVGDCENTPPAKTTFWIAGDGSAGVLGAASPVAPSPNIRTFSSLEELEAVATEWPMRFFVTIWNKLPAQPPVTRFENRRRALDRVWREIQKLPPQWPHSPSTRLRKRPDANRPQPALPNNPAARQSKSDQLIALLRAPGGARMAALMEATGWQAHTIRGFLSRRVSKQLGFALQSVRRDGDRIYSLPAVHCQDLPNTEPSEEKE